MNLTSALNAAFRQPLSSAQTERYELASLRRRVADAAVTTHTEPSDDQKAAGNYRKGRFWLHGKEFVIETPQGAVRRGKDGRGSPWESPPLPSHYGYIRRTLSEADGDHLDVFIGPRPRSPVVYVIDQHRPGGGFDEHKAMVGYSSEDAAKQAYRDSFHKSWQGLKHITALTVPQFLRWMDNGDTSKPIHRQERKWYSRITAGINAAMVERYANSHHAPQGGISIAGKNYPGGEFIPAAEIAKATPEERSRLEEKPSPHDLGYATGGWTSKANRNHDLLQAGHTNLTSKIIQEFQDGMMAAAVEKSLRDQARERERIAPWLDEARKIVGEPDDDADEDERQEHEAEIQRMATSLADDVEEEAERERQEAEERNRQMNRRAVGDEVAARTRNAVAEWAKQHGWTIDRYYISVAGTSHYLILERTVGEGDDSFDQSFSVRISDHEAPRGSGWNEQTQDYHAEPDVNFVPELPPYDEDIPWKNFDADRDADWSKWSLDLSDLDAIQEEKNGEIGDSQKDSYALRMASCSSTALVSDRQRVSASNTGSSIQTMRVTTCPSGAAMSKFSLPTSKCNSSSGISSPKNRGAVVCTTKMRASGKPDVSSISHSGRSVSESADMVAPLQKSIYSRITDEINRACREESSVERYAAQRRLFGGDENAGGHSQGRIEFDPDQHPRETTAHDTKKPGEFAPKETGIANTEPHPVTSALNEDFSLKRESATRFVPKDQTVQQADLFGETKLTHSPAYEAVKKQVESLPGQKSLVDDTGWTDEKQKRLQELDAIGGANRSDAEQEEHGRLWDEQTYEKRRKKAAADADRVTAAERDAVPTVEGAESFRSGEVNGKRYWYHAKKSWQQNYYSFDAGQTWDKSIKKAMGLAAGKLREVGTNEPQKSLEILDDDDPRKVAEKEAAATREQEYAFARKSEVPNAGQDLLGSARHKRNEWRGLANAEKEGTAAELVTRENLLRNEPPNLMIHADKNPLTALAMHYALAKFPAKPFDDQHHWYKRQGPEKHKQYRADYLSAYQRIKAEAERLAEHEPSPEMATSKLSQLAFNLMQEQRTKPGSYDPVANGLGKMYNAVNSSRFNRTVPPSHAFRGIQEFRSRANVAYGDKDTPQRQAKIAGHVKDILEGDSLNKTFGTVAKDDQKFDPASMYVEIAKRTGGRDVSQHTRNANHATKHLLDRFGMRGVQWGNSVTDEERQHHGGKIVEALTDLADTLGLAPSDIALNGKLGLAIGARGSGTALAHYEPAQQVINLTRKKGVGSLAHEWGHGFDHMLGGFGMRREGGDYQSEDVLPERVATDDKGKSIRENRQEHPVWKAMSDVREAWRNSGYNRRLMDVLSKMVSEKRMTRSRAQDYWNSHHEKFARTFERYVQHKLASKNQDNTYLAGFNTDTHWSSKPQHRDDGAMLWPTDAEVDAMTPAFDELFAAYRQKQHGSREPQKFSRQQLIAEINRLLVERYGQLHLFREDDHPRGQPENRGEFRAKESQPVVPAHDDNADLAARHRAGDKTATAELLDKNTGLIHHFAKRWAKNPADLDDLMQEGRLALLRAAQTHDPAKGKFSNYAAWWLRSRLPRKAAKLRSGFSSLTNQEGEQHNVTDAPKADDPLRRELTEKLSALMHRIPNREADVLSRLFGIGSKAAETLDSIGETMGITRQRVQQLAQRGMERLKPRLQQLGYSIVQHSTSLERYELAPTVFKGIAQQIHGLKAPTLAGQHISQIGHAIHQGISAHFDASKHPRQPQGTATGGQFVSKGTATTTASPTTSHPASSLGRQLATHEHFGDRIKAAGAGFTHAFRTSSGSQYLFKNGGTSRFKHSEGQGRGTISGHSSATHFVAPAMADNVRDILTGYALDKTHKASVRTVGKDQIGVVVKHRQTGAVDNSRSLRIPSQRTPTVGSSPIEVWDKNERGEYGHHIGHPISEIRPLSQPQTPSNLRFNIDPKMLARAYRNVVGLPKRPTMKPIERLSPMPALPEHLKPKPATKPHFEIGPQPRTGGSQQPTEFHRLHSFITGDRRPLSRNIQHGFGEGHQLHFASARQQDLYDFGARVRNAMRGKKIDNIHVQRQRLSSGLRIPNDKVDQLAFQVHQHVRDQIARHRMREQQTGQRFNDIVLRELPQEIQTPRLRESRLAPHDVAKAAAERHEVNHHDVLSVMNDLHQQRLDDWQRREEIRKDWLASHPSWNAAKLRRHEDSGHDADSIKGFDQTLEHMQNRGSFSGQGGTHRLLTSDQPEQELWDIIRAGAQPKPKLADEDLAHEAARYVAQHHAQFQTPQHALRRQLGSAFGAALQPVGAADEDTSFDFGANSTDEARLHESFSLRHRIAQEFYCRLHSPAASA